MKNVFAAFAAVLMTAVLATPIAADETSGFPIILAVAQTPVLA